MVPWRAIYERMRAARGHQHWWPGETPFEVCVGAILTQNTAWRNVEKAIHRLKAAAVLEPERLEALPEAELAELIRPAGTFRVKARRIRAFLEVLVGRCGGSLARLFEGETGVVRSRLLAIPGIGPETADCMLLYAGGHAVFVVDAYTRRILARHGWCGGDADYATLQALAEGSGKGVEKAVLLDYWQDYHAQLVGVGKDFCRAGNARCDGCPLREFLPEGARGNGQEPARSS